MNFEVIIILAGGFLGSLASIILKYGVSKKEFGNAGNYIFAFVLSFAIYWLYSFLTSEGYIPFTLSNLSLFGLAVFLGFAIDEAARSIWQLLKKRE